LRFLLADSNLPLADSFRRHERNECRRGEARRRWAEPII